MADTYPSFAALARNERSGIDYRVLVRRAEPAFAIVAPHGGGIEAGTSELADAIADERHSFSGFEGLNQHPDPDLQGREPANLCNRGTSCAGVQLELSRAVRATFFESLTRAGRKKPTPRFDVFVTAVRHVLA